LHWLLQSVGLIQVEFDKTLMNFFMMVFFCSVGFSASVSMLKKGSTKLILLLVLVSVMCVLQDLLGVGISKLMGVHPCIGLASGSISLLGGHGTSASYGPLLEELGISGANAVAIASATFGLVAGCIIGGPIAVARIRQFNLKSNILPDDEVISSSGSPKHIPLVAMKFVNATLLLAISIGIGEVILGLLNEFLVLPTYIGALLVATVIRNLMPDEKVPTHEIGVLGNLSLALFLGLAMINLKLWELSALALPMLTILLCQVALMVFFAYSIVFRVMGKNYDSAVMTAGFCGFGLGATPNAIANMEALTDRFGPSPVSYLIVPVVGALFLDFINATVITFFINVFH
ncbi:MAG: sodium/glutamate symporter, partial [Muribaculaceae bacterium]|nr:sodium/glutamate symporter [Muribaculaceae bacterium]